MIEDSSTRYSAAPLLPAVVARDSERSARMSAGTSSGINVAQTSGNTKACEKICAICLVTMKPGHGQAIFTAECSHSFHFRCIASNVKHGRQSCPVCRATWNEVPFQSPATGKSPSREGGNNVDGSSRPQNAEAFPRIRRRGAVSHAALHQSSEPEVYDDDDEVIVREESSGNQSQMASLSDGGKKCDYVGEVEIETHPELPAVPRLESHENFLVLVHLKAPVYGAGFPLERQTSIAPVDLVTVLDISGSMSGSKLALLKRAMGFVIQNLGPSDRLSVIAFSSTARRLFPLRRMTDAGRELALQAVNALSSNGGTNIAEGIKKGAKVMSDRKWKNAVSSMILLSDGQDSYNTIISSGGCSRSHFKTLLPASMHRDCPSGRRIPVHTFGFGADHDAALMHSISEETGGTFSFIEAESVMQDAFAQCLGGLLSVVVQELKLEVGCIHPLVRLTSVKSGSYKTILSSDNREASIEVGDLYAEEERDFLVAVDVPADESIDEMPLLKLRCYYKDPISKSSVTQDSTSNDVRIQRPLSMPEAAPVSIPVDKQRNRLHCAEAIAEAKAAAERGDLASATTILENCKTQLSATISARAEDPLVLALMSELGEMQQRMASRQVYETSGRAYVLSGLSSHTRQRTTTRGHSTDSGSSLAHLYQTPTMVDMVNLSQTMSFGAPPHPKNRRPRSSLARHSPR